jgi:hypothetical protein
MKRCIRCEYECESHLSTCPMCGESSWIELEPLYVEPQLIPVTNIPIPK